MKRRVVLINLLIFVGVVVFATHFRSAWESFEQGNNLEGIVASAQQEEGGQSPSPIEPMGRPGPFAEFVVVSEKTLFAEDRRPPSQEEVVGEVEEPAVVVEEPPKWAARPMLHGVSAMGGKRQGVMTVFEGDQNSGELRNVVAGDLVQGYWVDEIGETTMRLRWGDRREIIDMADATKPAAAGQSAAGNVTVINVGSAPSAVQTAAASTQQQGSGLEVSVAGGGASSGQGNAAQAGAAGRQGSTQPGGQGAQAGDAQRFIEGR